MTEGRDSLIEYVRRRRSRQFVTPFQLRRGITLWRDDYDRGHWVLHVFGKWLLHWYDWSKPRAHHFYVRQPFLLPFPDDDDEFTAWPLRRVHRG